MATACSLYCWTKVIQSDCWYFRPNYSDLPVAKLIAISMKVLDYHGNVECNSVHLHSNSGHLYFYSKQLNG